MPTIYVRIVILIILHIEFTTKQINKFLTIM